MLDPQRLSPVETVELEHAIAHALQFDGRTQFRLSADAMARITAAHLVECLRRGGFVIMKRAPEKSHAAPK